MSMIVHQSVESSRKTNQSISNVHKEEIETFAIISSSLVPTQDQNTTETKISSAISIPVLET